MPGKKGTVIMKENNGVADHFFAQLKNALPPGIGLAEELSDLLNISMDAAYRRIRGETEVTLAEVARILSKYSVSIDEIIGKRTSTASFTFSKLTDSEENFNEYLLRLHSQLTVINKFPNKKIFYIADEAPLFYSFQFPELTEFKLFFWLRSVLNVARFQHEKFKKGIVPQHLVQLAHQCFEEYMKIPCTEIWTEESVLTNIKQITYYYDSGLITREIALELLKEHRQLIEKVNLMAENGRKNISDQQETYALYCSDVVLGTNCIYVQMGELKYSYISFNSINSLTTNNAEFCAETESWVRNLEKKGTLISGVGEKQRYQFFRNMFLCIDTAVEKITAA